MEKGVTRAAETSVAVQAVLEAEIGEHNALQGAARTVCEALEAKGAQPGSSLRSRLVALSGQVCERLRGALHASIKCALAVVSSHYSDVDLEAISDGYVLPEDDKEADKEVMKLMEAAKGPCMASAKLFEEEVVPPRRPPMLETLSLDLGPRGHVNKLGIPLPYHNAGGRRGLFKVLMRLRFLIIFIVFLSLCPLSRL